MPPEIKAIRRRNHKLSRKQSQTSTAPEQAPTPKPTVPSWETQWAVWKEISCDWRVKC